MKSRIVSSLILCCLWSWTAESRNVFVVAPNVFRIGVDEKIVLAVDGIMHSEIMECYVQDYPGKRKNFSNTVITLSPGVPEIVTLTIKPEDVEYMAIEVPSTSSYVSLVAHSSEFHKETLIPLSIKSGYVFLQTDKPIYAPKQKVLFRIIALDEDTKPAQSNLRLQIRNPNNVVVRDTLENPRVFINPEPFFISPHPKFGNWSATVLYGYKFRQNTSITFEVYNYVLPIFTIRLDVPEIILPADKLIPITVYSRYLYGKPVRGVVTIRLGIENGTSYTTFFSKSSSKALVGGKYTLNVDTGDFKWHKDVGWFPNLEGFHLIVQATVTDSAGQRDVETGKGLFRSLPLVISFERCREYFKPGVISIIEADLTYVNGRVATGVETILTGTANGNLPLQIYRNESVSDEDGRIWFEIHPELHHTAVSVEVRTSDPKFEGMQSVVRFSQAKFSSRSNASIAINIQNGKMIQPGSLFSGEIYIENNGLPVTDFYFLVSARGKIVQVGKMPYGQFKIQRLQFVVTYEMAPSFLIVVFCHCNRELIADSRRVDVSNVCDPKASVNIDLQFYINEPGADGKIILHGSEGTMVGLLGVDSRVNTLSDENLLTKSKIFKAFASHDLSCGPGGGLTTDVVFQNAGLVILSNFYSPQNSKLSCARNIRKKRELTSIERIGSSNSGTHSDPKAVEIEDEMLLEDNVAWRKSFRETWLFTDIYIGSNGKTDYPVTLQHSITSWLIHAVSLSRSSGICVTDLQQIKSMKKIFLQLNIPHSVVRNKQIEIKATVFNHGSKKLVATVYMYGIKDLCSRSDDDQKSERKRISIDAHSAQSVYFPIIPFKIGTYNVKVVALSIEGSDVIVKELNVVPEGYQVENDISVVLDPYNQRKRSRQSIDTESFSDIIDKIKKLQVTSIKLKVPENIIPGTESCIVSVVGDESIPNVKTQFQNLENFLHVPRGIGEGNMIFFAPAVYAIQYLKLTGNISEENLEKGYDTIRTGYIHQLLIRKTGGSSTRSPGIWLTAFVTRVLCQASTLIYIDPDAICEAISWLVSKQNPQDGSFEEVEPVHYTDMMGGISGKETLTSYVLLTLKSCPCNIDTVTSQKMAVEYLESILNTITNSSSIAIVAYALSLCDSNMKYAANDKLLAQGKFNADDNTLHWNLNSSVASIEATSYALLTQLQLNDIAGSNSIVNWINVQQFFPQQSNLLQDTVIALNALSEYVIRTRVSSTNLALNFTSTSDINFYKVLNVDETNSHILQEIKIDTVRGMLFVLTSGNGIGHLNVKLTFNLPPPPPEELCKFNVMVNVSNTRNSGNNLSHPRIEGILAPDDSGMMSHLDSMTEIRSKKKDGLENFVLTVTVCVQYLGDHEAAMSIVDVGVFSGFSPIDDDLKELVKSPNSFINDYEVSDSGVLFHLTKVPHTEPYCFGFRIKREFIVGYIVESRVVKVYEDYKPDEFCSMFYRPDDKSPMLRTICSNGTCMCAEGGCPPRNPFFNTERSDLYTIACDDHDYVWKGKVINNEMKNGFRNLEFQVHDVIKEGIEVGLIEEESRTLTVSSNCETGNLVVHQEYIIMGNDGVAFEKDDGKIRYLLNRKSKIKVWSDFRNKNITLQEKRLQRNLSWLEKQLRKNGCEI